MYIKTAFNLAIALSIVTAFRLATAQPAPSPTRPDVKRDTAAAERAHQLTPAGEGPFEAVPRTFTRTRDERKAETRSARHDRTLQPAGEAAMAKDDRRLAAAPSTVNRAERKAQVRADEIGRRLTPAGEGPDAPRK